MSKSTAIVSILCISLITGCAGLTPQTRQVLYEPARCENATSNIRSLESDRPGGGQRFLHGLQAILPPAIVIGLLRDIFWGKPYRSIYLDHWRIAFGSYSKRIDTRVGQLSACPSSLE